MSLYVNKGPTDVVGREIRIVVFSSFNPWSSSPSISYKPSQAPSVPKDPLQDLKITRLQLTFD